jgi:hypothetical protein
MSMENDLFNDVAILVTIERLAHNNLLHHDDFTGLAQRLHTEWARTTADTIASRVTLDDESESILNRFSSVRRTWSTT